MTCSLDGVKPVVVPPGGFPGKEKEPKGSKGLVTSMYFLDVFLFVFPPWDLHKVRYSCGFKKVFGELVVEGHFLKSKSGRKVR